MIRLPNGNVKFLHTNWKHFTVGDQMAFPIVKMGNKNPQSDPFPLHDVDPRLIHQCLSPLNAPPQTAAPTVEALLHTDAVKCALVTMARPKFAPKVPLPVNPSPNPTICLIRGPVRPTMPNGTRIRSAIFPQCTGQTDAPTDRQIGKADYSPLRL